MNKIKVSFCIPVYKTEELLIRCIKSVVKCGLEQNEFEIIIVNDGDNRHNECKNIISQFKETYPDILFKFSRHKNNLGLLEVRRTAVELARGDYICVVDSDDFINPGSVKRVIDSCDIDYDIIQTNYEVISVTNDRKYDHPFKMEIHESKSLLKTFLLGEFMTGFLWGKLIKTSIYKEIFKTIPFIHLNYCEDLVQLVFLTSESKTYICLPDETMYFYDKTNNNSITSKEITKKGLISEIDEYKKVMTILNPDSFNDDDLKNKIGILHLSQLKLIKKRINSLSDNSEIVKYFKSQINEIIYEKI